MKNSSNDIIELQVRSKSPSPALQFQQENAVYVRNAYKKYGIINPVDVLSQFNMTVPKGVIYGLLGASGCGKTTILNCIIGYSTLDAGDLWVLGGKPCSKLSGTPGPRIGYMPQETGLYNELTMRETLSFFGKMFGMTRKKIQERSDFLINLLMLPQTNHMNKELSGGQQRRVSLAVTLLHEPELLILDEPTVGVDPVLRQLVWSHFLDITKKGNVTIVITTHYIEETQQAHLIGFMRGGCLMAEDTPSKIRAQFNTSSMEEVFLKLSLKQNAISNYDHVVNKNTLQPKRKIQHESLNYPYYHSLCDLNHLWALTWKHMLWVYRNIHVVLFIIFLPVVIMCLFCTFIGRDPVNIPLAVVNDEMENTFVCDKRLTCDSQQLSCHYLEHLKRRKLILTYYESEEEAKAAVIRNEVFASVTIKKNYSDALRSRIENWKASEPWDLEYSNIEVFRDAANKFLVNYLQVYLYESFQNFIQDYLESCGANRRVLTLPVKFESAVHGLLQPNFTDYAVPGILLTLIFYLSISMTAGSMLIERNEGSLQRTFVVGANNLEILLALFGVESIIMTVQTILSMMVTFLIFDMTIKGSLILATMFMILTGFCGMAYGIVIACICDRDLTTHLMATGSIIPILTMSGIIWPVEATHYLLQPLSPYFPLTQTIQGMRSILQRDWGIDMANVYMGCVSIVIWTIIFILISVLSIKFKRH